MKLILTAFAVSTCLFAAAQVSNVSLQASGLTCSMCSNSINKALKSLPSVAVVTANIKNSTFDISFKPGAKVNFDELKKKVEDAGFFVAKMTAKINFSNQLIENDGHLVVNGLNLHFLNVTKQTLNGVRQLQILDKGYVSAKEFKKNELYTKMDCYNTGVAGACCVKPGLPGGQRIYHVTI